LQGASRYKTLKILQKKDNIMAKTQQAANPFADAFKSFADFKPTVDFNTFFAAQKKNAEAFAAASQVLTAGFQAVARRQAEIAQANAKNSLQLTKELFANAGNPEASTAKQAEFAKEVVETGLSNTRELVELASKSSIEAFDLINKRLAESLSEITEAAEAKK
jgi:phasin family protein